MPTITFEANEHGQLRVELRGVAASYAGAEIVLAGGPAYSDAPLSTWASVAGVAPGDGEVAGYDLPLPQLEPGRYALEVYAATPGERRADLMPAPGETIVLKVGDRRHDNADTTPPAQVTVQQGTSAVRETEGREGSGVRLYVADPSGTRLDGEATHTIAASPLVVPTAGEVDVPTTYQEAMAAGYDGTAAEFYAALVARGGGSGLATDELGRVPSAVTDAGGEVPLRARLDAIVSAAEGAATPGEVEALLSGLADAHETLLQEHETLQAEHADLIELVGQVLAEMEASKAREEALAETARTHVKTDWMDLPSVTVQTEAEARSRGQGSITLSDPERFREVLFQGQVAAQRSTVIRPYWYLVGLSLTSVTADRDAGPPAHFSTPRRVYGEGPSTWTLRVGTGDANRYEPDAAIQPDLFIPPASESFELTFIRARLVGILL